MNKSIFEQEFEKLNEEQKKAVDNIYWPVMVVAWPGTWKTQIIALRTANIIDKSWADASNILITTFTEAWVIAIRKRLVKFLWQDWYKVKVSTFHAFASEVISDFPEKFLEQRAKQTIDDIESYEILSEILDKKIESWEIKELFNSMDKYAFLRDIKDRIWKLKTEWLSPEWFSIVIKKQENEYNERLLDLENNKRIRDLEKRRKKDKDWYDKHINKLKELNLIYKEYSKIIKEKWFYDFADMINFVTDKFKNDEEILAYYAEKFQFMMIDEFQDTNNSQNQIINLMLDYFPEEQNIMVVWDDDQSIYRFQWANIENMLDFTNRYPNTKHIVLDKNYRSSQDILNISQELIENNSQRISNKIEWINKNLTAEWEYKKYKENNLYMLENDLKEKEFVYREIENKNWDWETFAIIVKTNRQVEEWSLFLKQKWLKVNSKNSSNILNNHYCNFLLNFIKFVNNPYFDDNILLDLIRSDLVDIENIDAIYMSRSLYQKNYSRSKYKLWLWDIIKDIENDEYAELKNLEKIIKFKDLVIDLNSSIWNWGTTKAVRDILEKLEILIHVEKNGSFDDLQDIFTLVNKIKWYIENNKEISLSNISNKFDLYKKFNVSIARESIKSINSNIEILTAHASKWLEYDHVFIPEVYEWNWNKKALPDKLKLPIWISWDGLQYSNLDEKEYKNLEKEISLEEERRLFFVAITRAKKSLTFTVAWSRDNKIQIKSSFMESISLENNELDLDINEDQLKKILISSMTNNNELVKTNEDEINFIAKFLEDYKLSPTDLNKFLDDPKTFLREVVFRYPFLSNENLVFWSAYHKVLELVYISKEKNDLISKDELINLFVEEINKYDLSKDEYDRLLERAKNWLTWYYELILNNKRTSVANEYNFRSKNVIFNGIPLTWKIDKIELINDNNIALIDYKTGSIKTIWVIKWVDRYWNKKEKWWNYLRQLLFYKLMFDNTPELNKKYNLTELWLDFVEWKKGEYKYLNVDYNEEEYNYFLDELKYSWEKINDLEFWKNELK